MALLLAAFHAITLATLTFCYYTASSILYLHIAIIELFAIRHYATTQLHIIAGNFMFSSAATPHELPHYYAILHISHAATSLFPISFA
jgi:hypothetical protein